MLSREYPQEPPLVFLDEPENQEVIDIVDYIDSGNRINFQFLFDWRKQQSNDQGFFQKFNLTMLLTELYNLFLKMPPVSFSELFGGDADANPIEDKN